jgi:type I restriction enzyme R subunit
LKYLFGELPNFYANEDELRRIWADPLTRIELLTRLDEHGFSRADLHRIQELISATDSDLFDVLAFISFSSPRKTRRKRALTARVKVAGELEERPRRFIDFVLDQYEVDGDEELEPDKLAPLLTLKFGSVTEGLTELGVNASTARETFCSFQRHLYEDAQ